MESVITFIASKWEVLFGGIGTTIVGLVLGLLIAQRKSHPNVGTAQIVVNYQAETSSHAVHEIAQLVNELSLKNHDSVRAEAISLAKAEKMVYELSISRKQLEEEIEEYKNIKREKELELEKLQLARDRARVLMEADVSRVIPNLSGIWNGKTGLLHLKASGASVNGTYDWGAAKNIGFIKGRIEENIFKFEWDWSKRLPATIEGKASHVQPSGVGYFILEENGKSLRGGWFSSTKDIDLEKAQNGAYDSHINPWVFVRAENAQG